MVSNIFYFHPYLGKWSKLTNTFQMGWNHQLESYPKLIHFWCFLTIWIFIQTPEAWCVFKGNSTGPHPSATQNPSGNSRPYFFGLIKGIMVAKNHLRKAGYFLGTVQFPMEISWIFPKRGKDFSDSIGRLAFWICLPFMLVEVKGLWKLFWWHLMTS